MGETAIQRLGSTTLVSRDGYEFDPATRTWHLSRDSTVHLAWIDTLLADSLRNSVLALLAHYAVTYSAAHTYNMAGRLQHFAKMSNRGTEALSVITAPMIINYRSVLDREHEYFLGMLKGFLKTWCDLGYPGIDTAVPDLLDSLRLRGNIKGRAVQTMCPKTGALSDLEFEALQQRALDGYEFDELVLDEFVLVLLFVSTGRRPAQLSDLKGRDLVSAQAGSLREFVLNIPRRKGRGLKWREELKPTAVTPEIGEAIQLLIQENESKLLSLYPECPRNLLGWLPLFPNWKAISQSVPDFTQTSVREWLEFETFHLKTAAISYRVERVTDSMNIPSERTGGNIRVFPTRLRRTIATRAAREGYGPLIIAELLDHGDDQNARVYTENVPENVDAINAAIAHQLAPLAQAFAGVLVDIEAAAIRGGDSTSRVRTNSGTGAGTCGHYGFCGACAPIACYTCRHFQPWLDGAHQEVLDTLLSERERLLTITQDHAMASINDRTIFAVAEVIHLCDARRAEIEKEELIG